DDGEFRSGNHGGNADGQLGDGGRGGREHRSGGSHRKPGRDNDNGWRSGDDAGGQGIDRSSTRLDASRGRPQHYVLDGTTQRKRDLDSFPTRRSSDLDDGEFRSGNHGGNADGQLGDGGRGGREHRSGGSHRKPGRDNDNGWRSGDDAGGQG